MKAKRIVVLVIAVSLLFSLFTGCGKVSDTEKNTPEETNNPTPAEDSTSAPVPEKKTFTFYYGDSNAKPVQWSETPVGKKVTELTGVTLEMSFCAGSDEKTKVSLMIASGEYPDIMFPHNETNQFIDAEALVDLTDLVEQHAPNIKKYFGDKLRKFVDPKSGRLLSIQQNQPAREKVYQHTGFWLQADVMESAGWPKKLTFDKYIDVIRQYAKNNPTIDGKQVIPFSVEAEGWRNFCLTLLPAFVNGHMNEGAWITDQKTFDVRLIFTDEVSKNFLAKLNQLWIEGLFDKEAFTQPWDSLIAKVSQGRILGMYDHRWQIQDAINSLEAAEMYDKVPVWTNVLEEGITDDSYQFQINQDSGPGGLCISKNCKDPVGVLKYLDSLLGEDVQILNFWGIEGVDYTVGGDGKFIISPEQIQNYLNTDYESNHGYKQFWMLKRDPNSKLSNGNFAEPKQETQFFQSSYKPYEMDILKKFGIASFTELVAPQKETIYGSANSVVPPMETHEAESIARKRLDETVNQYVPRLIMAGQGKYDAIWTEYMGKVKEIGIDGYIKYVNDTVKKRVEEWK